MERANRRQLPYLAVDEFYPVVFREDPCLTHLGELVNSEAVSADFRYDGMLPANSARGHKDSLNITVFIFSCKWRLYPIPGQINLL